MPRLELQVRPKEIYDEIQPEQTFTVYEKRCFSVKGLCRNELGSTGADLKKYDASSIRITGNRNTDEFCFACTSSCVRTHFATSANDCIR